MKTKLFFPALLIAFFAVGPIQHALAQNCITPPSGMVTWLPGDANPQDILNHALDVAVSGTVALSPGMVGNAFTFNGSGHITYSTINAGNNYTIDFWVKPSSAGPINQRQAILGNTFSDKFGNISLGFDQIEYSQEGASSILHHKVRSPKIPYDTWTHVALTYDGQVNRLYINGSLIPNQPNGDNSVFGTSAVHSETFNNPIRLGQTIGNTGMTNFHGQLDEVEIFNRVLSEAEIKAIVSATSAGKCKTLVDADGDGIVDGRDACPGTPAGTAVNASGCPAGACFSAPSGLAHWFPGDGNANDVQGGKNGTLGGTVTFPAGKVDQAFSFNDTGGAAYPTLNVGSAYTVDFWIRPTGDPGVRREVISNDTSSPNFGIIVAVYNSIAYNHNGSDIVSSPQGSVPQNIFTHVTLTYDGQVNRLYINGNHVGTSGVHCETFNNPLKLGDFIKYIGNNRFIGQLDEVKIFNRALTQTEIRGIFNADAANVCFIGNGVAEKTLGNISTRMPVLTGENVLIGGIIVTGNVPKRVIVRGLGPSLEALGVAGTLADPVLELYQGNTLLFSNDNWQDSQAGEISATGVAPGHPLEAAIVRTLDPGSYTAILRGNGNITGVGLVDGYDLNQDPNSKLANISTRGFVGAGDGALIAGFISGPNTRVVIRAIGPSLSNLGINGALENPTLQLVDANGGVVRSNDNWKDGQRAELEAIGIQPSDDRESAIIEVLNAASYTAVVRGTNNTTGVGLVEVYNLQ